MLPAPARLLQSRAALAQHALAGAHFGGKASCHVFDLLTGLSALPMVATLITRYRPAVRWPDSHVAGGWQADATPSSTLYARLHLALACLLRVQQMSALGAAAHTCRPDHRSAESCVSSHDEP